MTLLAPLGLLLLALVALPIIAHSLRSGPRAEVLLPTARFAKVQLAASEKRKSLEERGLLALRALLIASLALLSASPFASCSSLTLSRPSGGSVALGLVIDDSASMLVEHKGLTRFERAVSSALELLATARDGDSFTVVLAGAPARTLLPRTSNVDDVARALRSLEPSERATDLAGAIAMAEKSLEGAPQPEKQIAVLSDGASPDELPLAGSGITLSFPVPELSGRFENCAILRAERDNAYFTVETECTSQLALEDRKVQFVKEGERRSAPLASAPLVEDGLLRVAFPAKEPGDRSEGRWVAELSPSPHDDLRTDDVLEIPARRDDRAVAVYADRTSAGVETSDRTVVELALESLDAAEQVRPLRSLPEKPDELADVSVLIVDNPPGFGPETQNALESFVARGGVLLTLLGNAVDAAPLSAGFWPITRSSPRYLPLTKDKGEVRVPLDSASEELGRGYDTLKARHRALLEAPLGSQVLLGFADGTPLLLERQIGLGLALTSTLSASVEQSDFALRPGFLAILDRVLEAGRGDDFTGSALPGVAWKLPDGVVIQDGAEKAVTRGLGRRSFTPELAGVYFLESGNLKTARQVARHPQEHTRQPSPKTDPKAPRNALAISEKVSISREIALGLLALSALELWLRRLRSGPRKSPAIGQAS